MLVALDETLMKGPALRACHASHWLPFSAFAPNKVIRGGLRQVT